MIRPGRPGDVAAIAALNTAYRRELAAAGRPEERPADVWRRWLDRRISAGDVRVAVEDEEIVDLGEEAEIPAAGDDDTFLEEPEGDEEADVSGIVSGPGAGEEG